MNKKQFLAYNGWDPLEEIWLGDVWPQHFYDDLSPEVRDAFYQITEWTKQDLKLVEDKFKELGVDVIRPVIDESNKSLYTDPATGNLYKPPITPRDDHCVIGDKLYFSDQPETKPWTDVLKKYDNQNIVYTGKDNSIAMVSGANTVRIGKDILFDRCIPEGNPNNLTRNYFNFRTRLSPSFEKDYRVHYTANGGHVDGCFATLKPGLLLATDYFNDYELFFPGWDKIILTEPTYANQQFFNHGTNPGKWWLMASPTDPVSSPQFNNYVQHFCKEWIGNFTETYFEVNVVMVDEKNMICMGVHDRVFKELEKYGITCHAVPFRTRTFWDGGIHCLTLDIRRQATLKDYFPQRGDPGMGYQISKLGPQLEIEYNKTIGKI